MTFFGIVCGLMSEAAAVKSALEASGASPSAYQIGVSGARAGEARAIAERFAGGGAKALMSVGVSGGLDPTLQPGDLIETSNVHGVDLAPALRVAPDGELIHGADVIIQTAEQKARLLAGTGAVAVDMESHAVAGVASERGLPFLAVRAIADPADRALPPAAMNAVAPDGSTRVMATLLEIAKAPGQLPALLKLGSDSAKATARLSRDFGPLFLGLLRRFDL